MTDQLMESTKQLAAIWRSSKRQGNHFPSAASSCIIESCEKGFIGESLSSLLKDGIVFNSRELKDDVRELDLSVRSQSDIVVSATRIHCQSTNNIALKGFLGAVLERIRAKRRTAVRDPVKRIHDGLDARRVPRNDNWRIFLSDFFRVNRPEILLQIRAKRRDGDRARGGRGREHVWWY